MFYAVNPDDGVRVACDVVGSGPPLVLLHGSGASSVLWHELGYVSALERDYRLILVDARGHGRSDKPRRESAYAMRRFVGDLVAVLDDLGLDQAHYFGYSMGGRIAFGIGRYAPERFASLAVGGGSYRTAPGWFDRLTFPGAIETIASEGVGAFLDAWERRRGTRFPEWLRTMYLANDATALAAYLRASDREPSYEMTLSRMAMPALMIVGERDEERFGQSRSTVERLPDARLAVIPDADHAGALLRREAVMPHLASFLSRVACDAAVPVRL